MLKRSYDVVIVGGGVMGSSIAYHLSKLAQGSAALGGKNLSIAVIEKDKKYLTASAMLSAGGIRQHFSESGNTLMSMYGVELLKSPETLQVDDCVPDFQVCFSSAVYTTTHHLCTLYSVVMYMYAIM
jgi:FAD-dependent oxidoreductase domain-containing protein 1